MDVAISGTYVYSRIYFAGVSPIFYKRDQSIIGLYGVYGLSDKCNVFASLPVINVTPQDLSLYVKYKLYSKRFEDGEITTLPAFGVSFPVWSYYTKKARLGLIETGFLMCLKKTRSTRCKLLISFQQSLQQFHLQCDVFLKSEPISRL